MNLSHTLASNEAKQLTSILAEKKLLQQKFNIIHHTTNKRAIERNTETPKQMDGNGKMKPDNLRKTDGSVQLKKWGERNV